jgi:hypothetical protein
VVTGASAVSINPDLVTQVRWWLHPSFQDPAHVAAAELVAFKASWEEWNENAYKGEGSDALVKALTAMTRR